MAINIINDSYLVTNFNYNLFPVGHPLYLIFKSGTFEYDDFLGEYFNYSEL